MAANEKPRYTERLIDYRLDGDGNFPVSLARIAQESELAELYGAQVRRSFR